MNDQPTQPTASAARLIAELIESQAWSMPRDCAEHPILGPAIALRKRIYGELRSEDFTKASLAADEASVQSILDAVNFVSDHSPLHSAWMPIATAPLDGTVVWTHTAAAHDLPAFQGPCAYHPDAGWCTDELREVTHWVPLRAVYLEPPDHSPDASKMAPPPADEAAHDRAYRNGWMQAWREWSACMGDGGITQAALDRLERRRVEMEKYGR